MNFRHTWSIVVVALPVAIVALGALLIVQSQSRNVEATNRQSELAIKATPDDAMRIPSSDPAINKPQERDYLHKAWYLRACLSHANLMVAEAKEKVSREERYEVHWAEDIAGTRARLKGLGTDVVSANLAATMEESLASSEISLQRSREQLKVYKVQLKEHEDRVAALEKELQTAPE